MSRHFWKSFSISAATIEAATTAISVEKARDAVMAQLDSLVVSVR